MDQERSVEGAVVSETGNPERTPEQVKAEIEQTREQLGETVEALAARTDVKGQAKQAVDDARTTVSDKVTGVKDSVASTAQNISASAQEATPASMSDAGTQASRFVREQRPVVVGLGAFALGLLLGRRRS